MAMIGDKIAVIRKDIEDVCRKIGKDPDEIILVGVTKYADVQKIQVAIDGGLTHIGENKVQEAQKKFSALNVSGRQVTKHMIGHLQTNKVKSALKIFDMIESVDSLRLAEEIDRQAQTIGRKIDMLVQVNTSGEEQKFGIPAEETFNLIDKISNLQFINVLGLMTIAPLTEDTDRVRRCFRDARILFQKAADKFKGSLAVKMHYLSMGMTHDYKMALEEGSNMVRIGRAIFE